MVFVSSSSFFSQTLHNNSFLALNTMHCKNESKEREWRDTNNNYYLLSIYYVPNTKQDFAPTSQFILWEDVIVIIPTLKMRKPRLIGLWGSCGQHTAQPGFSLCLWDSRERHWLPCIWSPAPSGWMKSPPHTPAPQLTKGHLSVTRTVTGSRQHWLSSRVFIRWWGFVRLDHRLFFKFI